MHLPVKKVILAVVYWEIRDMIITTEVSTDDSTTKELVYVTDFDGDHTPTPNLNE